MNAEHSWADAPIVGHLWEVSHAVLTYGWMWKVFWETHPDPPELGCICLLLWSMTTYLIGRKERFLLAWALRGHTPCGSGTWGLRAHFPVHQEADTRQEAGPWLWTSRPAPSNALLLLKFITPKIAPPAGDQVLKHSSLWGTSYIHTTAQRPSLVLVPHRELKAFEPWFPVTYVP